MNEIITYKLLNEGTHVCTLDLSLLYSTQVEIDKFDQKYNTFIQSDTHLTQIMTRNGNIIQYQHKSWIPNIQDGRPQLLFLFGNPAPHSVLANIYFAYEGRGQPHRFWKVMKELKIIDIDTDSKTIRNSFFNLKYKAPYVIGMDVIFTFPTPASEKKWSGVQGIYILFGKKATEKLINNEKLRIKNIIKNFNNQNLKIIAMQKDAFEAISNTKYDIKKAVNGELHVRNDVLSMLKHGVSVLQKLSCAS